MAGLRRTQGRRLRCGRPPRAALLIPGAPVAAHYGWPASRSLGEGWRPHGDSNHSFRHFLTSQLHRSAVAPAIVRDIIGHESEAVHRIYTDIDDETKLLGIRKFVVLPPSSPPPAQGGVIEDFPEPSPLKEAVNG